MNDVAGVTLGRGWVVFAAGTIGSLLAILATADLSTVPAGDSEVYAFMADHPGVWVTDPTSFRLAVPWLVGVLPFGVGQGFALVGAVALGLTFTWLDEYLERSTVGLVAFALCPAVVTFTRNPYYVDAVLWACVVGAMLAARRGRWGWFAVATLAGAASHELALIVIPAAAFAGRNWRVVLRASIPAVAYYVATRFTPVLYGELHTSARYTDPSHVGVVMGWQDDNHGSIIGGLWSAFAGSFSVLWVFAVVGWRYADEWTRRSAVMLLPAAGMFLFVTDWDRMLSVCFPVVVGLGCAALREGTFDDPGHGDLVAGRPGERDRRGGAARDVVRDEAGDLGVAREDESVHRGTVPVGVVEDAGDDLTHTRLRREP